MSDTYSFQHLINKNPLSLQPNFNPPPSQFGGPQVGPPGPPGGFPRAPPPFGDYGKVYLLKLHSL